MVEDLKITIGGHERPVRLTGADGVTLRRHFKLEGESIGAWLVANVLGINFAGSMAAYNLEAQHAIVALAINRAAGKNTKAHVTDSAVGVMFDEMFAEMAAGHLAEDAVKRVLWTCVESAYRAGWVMQKPFDLRKELPDLYAIFFGLTAEEVAAETTSSAQPQQPFAIKAEA